MPKPLHPYTQLLRSPTLPLVERLRLLLTASDILRGQGEALTIDRRDFYARLYEALALAPYRQLGEAEGGWKVPWLGGRRWEEAAFEWQKCVIV